MAIIATVASIREDIFVAGIEICGNWSLAELHVSELLHYRTFIAVKINYKFCNLSVIPPIKPSPVNRSDLIIEKINRLIRAPTAHLIFNSIKRSSAQWKQTQRIPSRSMLSAWWRHTRCPPGSMTSYGITWRMDRRACSKRGVNRSRVSNGNLPRIRIIVEN